MILKPNHDNWNACTKKVNLWCHIMIKVINRLEHHLLHILVECI